MDKRGIVMVITGNGKGKTTSALGQAVRAVGHGFKIIMIQFLKGWNYGELKGIKYLPGVTMVQGGRKSWINKDNPEKEDIALAQEAFKEAAAAVNSGEYDMVILDEINVAVNYGLLAVKDVVDLIKGKPYSVDLILTGRDAAQEVQDAADMVSEIREIKHHYKAGIAARKGIEF